MVLAASYGKSESGEVRRDKRKENVCGVPTGTSVFLSLGDGDSTCS